MSLIIDWLAKLLYALLEVANYVNQVLVTEVHLLVYVHDQLFIPKRLFIILKRW